MKKKKISIIGISIAAFVVSLVVSLSIYFVILEERINEIHFEEVHTDNSEIAHSAVQFFNARITEELDTIIGIEIAHHNVIGQENVIFDEEYYFTMLSNSEYMKRIEVLNLSGEVLFSTNTSENRVGINISDYYLLEPLTDVHKLSIGNLIYDATYESLALEVAYSGEDVIITSLISIEFFELYGDEFNESFSEKEIMILNNEGKYIYDSYNSSHLIQNFYPDFDLLIENSNTFDEELFSINSEDCIVNVEMLDINEWRVVIYETEESALATNAISNGYYTYTLLGITALILIVFGGIVIVLLQDFSIISNRFNDIVKGVYGDDLESSFIKESDRLRDGFNQMKNNLRQSNKKLEFYAYYDELTGLATKNKAYELFDLELDRESISVVYIDIMRFEVINDNYGYSLGDSVLQYISSLFKNYFDEVFRVHSDEFMGFLYDTSKEKTFEIVENLIQLINKGLDVEDIKIPIDLRIGISRYPNHGDNLVELMRKATISNHEAKENKECKYLCFDDTQSEKYIRRSSIELLITNAVQTNQFKTVYQPIIDAKTKKVRGFEALSRWENDKLGFVSPDEFIPVLEKNHKIAILDMQVLDKTLRLNRLFIDKYKHNLVACVNISVNTIMRNDFVDLIEERINKYDYPPHLLELEITETTLITDYQVVSKKINELKELGVRFSEDDFGDAYSSLTYLASLEIDTIKISKNFLSKILANKKNLFLAKTILELSQNLGFNTVIEGVEDEETFTIFKDLGCDFVQGFLFYKPVSKEDLEEIIKNQ